MRVFGTLVTSYTSSSNGSAPIYYQVDRVGEYAGWIDLSVVRLSDTNSTGVLANGAVRIYEGRRAPDAQWIESLKGLPPAVWSVGLSQDLQFGIPWGREAVFLVEIAQLGNGVLTTPTVAEIAIGLRTE